MANDTDNRDDFYFTLNTELQYALNNRFALTMKPYFTFDQRTSESTSYKDIVESYNYGFDPGIRVYIHDTRLRRRYIGLHLIFGLSHNHINQVFDEKTFTENYFKVGFAGEFGYQWIVRGGFTFSVGGTIGRSTYILYQGDSRAHRPYTWFDYIAHGMRFWYGIRTLTLDRRNLEIREMPLNEINSKISFGYSF